MKIEFEAIDLKLAKTWKISRNSSDMKTNYICSLKIEDQLFLGECAPNIRYGESHESIQKWINKISNISNISELEQFITDYEIPHSLECSLRNALFKYKLFEKKIKAEEYLNIKKVSKDKVTSFSFPIMNADEVTEYYQKNNQYHVYKVKITNLDDLEFLKSIRELTSKPIRIDANEGFDNLEDYLKFDELIKDLNIEFVEQPFKSEKSAWYQQIKEIVNVPLMADESIEKDADFNELSKQFHMINIKLQKCGGIQRASELIKEAKRYQLKIMLGCMIETSLGIGDALILGEEVDFLDLDGSLLLKRDPFNFLSLKDGLISLN